MLKFRPTPLCWEVWLSSLEVTVDGISDGQPIAEEFAFGIRTKDTPFTFGPNISPAIR